MGLRSTLGPPPSSDMRKALSLLFGLLISAIAVVWGFRGLDWDGIQTGLRTLSWSAVALYVLSLLIIHVLRTARWALMVRVLDPKVSVYHLVGMSFLGFAGVFLVPLRLGELARPLLLKVHSRIGFSAGLGTVAIERAVDGLVMTGFLVGAILLGAAPSSGMLLTGTLALGVFVGASLAFAAMARWPHASEAFWGRLLSPFGERIRDAVLGLLRGFVEGLGSLPTHSARLNYLGLTFAYWGLNGLGMWFLATQMGLSVSLQAMFVTMALLVVGIMVPAGPGAVGTFHAAIIWGLSHLYGVDRTGAAAFALTVHGLQVIHMLLVSLPFVGLIRQRRGEVPDQSSSVM